MSEAPHTERSLADRVDAIERALTDDDSTAAPGIGPTVSVTTERVDCLEADLADLRASVDALRSVVGSLDRRATDDRTGPASADPTTESVPDDTARTDTRGTLDTPVRSPEPLHAPTGRPIPLSDDEALTPNVDSADAQSEPTEREGILSRVTETL